MYQIIKESHKEDSDVNYNIKNCIVCNNNGIFQCCCSIHYCSKEHQKSDWKRHKKICLKAYYNSLLTFLYYYYYYYYYYNNRENQH